MNDVPKSDANRNQILAVSLPKACNRCSTCPVLEIVSKKQDNEHLQCRYTTVKSFTHHQSEHIPLTVIFADAEKIRNCTDSLNCLTEVFKFPETWWSPFCQRANGYFGCENTYDLGEQVEISGYNTWFRFLIKRTRIEKPSYGPEKDYDWLKFNIFTRWIPSSEETIIIAFDIAPDIKNRLLQLLFNAINSESRSNPYLYHMVIAEEVLSLQSEAVWNIRTKVRHVEQTRTAPSPNYNRLHELARHAIHVVETLDLAERTFHSMITHHEQFTAGTTKPKRFQHFIDDRLCFYKEGVQSLRLRSIANKDRLLNEIQCSFNFVAQNIASTSMETNQSLQSDSSAMKSIMLLTSAFVPLTYIATLFSMSFFSLNTESGRWLMSDRFWLYWVVSVPFTVAAAFLSYLYHSRFILQKAKHS